MADEGRVRKRWRRSGVPTDARDRLGAAEARIAEIAASQAGLLAALDARHRELLASLEAQGTATEVQFEAVRAQAKEDYRRQVGVLDVVRRQQKRQDDTFGGRVEAVEAAVSGLATEQVARLAQAESRLDQLDVTARMVAGRIDAFESFRVDLGSIIERMNTTIKAIRDAVEKLATRTDATEALARQQLTDATALREQVVTAQRAAETAADTLRAAVANLGSLEAQIGALNNAVAPLGPVPERMDALAESVAAMNDRVVAAELVLNQRNDLDLQLERAEEFERVLAEVDPADYASRDDLDALRQIVEELRGNPHAE